MDLSIVIVSYNTRDMLRDCLASLPAATNGLEIETFVVDNASPDDSAEMARTKFPNVDVIANATNAGFTTANNQALKLAVGRHVLILNPDTEPEQGSLTAMAAFLDSHPDYGACGPMLLNSDGTLQPNGRRFPTLYREFLGVTGLRNLNRAAFDVKLEYGRRDLDVECDVDQVMGACMMVRGDVVRQIGSLDEAFFMFYEEIEWSWRIRKAGWKIAYVPSARVVHHWMGSVRQQRRAMTARLFRSMIIYYRKTDGPLIAAAAYPVAFIGLAKNEILYAGVAVKRVLRSIGLVR